MVILRMLLLLAGLGLLAGGQAWAAEPATTSLMAPSSRDQLSVVLTSRRESVISAEVRAQVNRIHREFGQSFNTGQVLIELDSSTFHRLNLDKAEVMLEAARKAHAVTLQLFNEKSASILELEKTKADLAVAEVNRRFALRGVTLCRVVAPYAGRVEKLFVNEHELVDEGRPLVKIVDDSVLRARIILPSDLFGSLKVGQPMNILIKETGKEVAAKISHISAVLDPASGTFEVYAEVDNAGGAMRSGMTGRLQMAGGRR
ncbi:MAG: efflux RND transporter periplasmic adaptor subunit [Desulfarculus sp.]|nr:efflux RND transporter periplasmic adaptor subunit [Desulfarculus sp.]